MKYDLRSHDAGQVSGGPIKQKVHPVGTDDTSGRQTAYQFGCEAANRYRGSRWEDIQNELERGWERARGGSKMMWPEVKDGVHQGWNDSRFGFTGDQEWDQMYPASARRGALQVPLQDLHDPRDGRLHAGRVAESLKIPLKQLAEALGKNYSTVHKTPTAPDVQSFLQSVKTILVILEDVLVDRPAVLAWLNHPHPDLGYRTPLDVILQGHPDAVKGMLQAAVMGIPS